MPGRRGQGVLFTVGDGFFFSFNSKKISSAGARYLKCTDCNMRAVLTSDGMLRLTCEAHSHSHPPSTGTEQLSVVKEQLKKRAMGTVLPLRQIFNEVP